MASDRPSADPAHTLYAQALRYFKSGMSAQAAQACQAGLALNDRHAASLHLAGLLALQAGRPEETVDFITRAIASDPSQAGYYVDLGIALQRLGQSDAAVANYDKALALQGDYIAALYNKANALKSLLEFEAAVECYSRVLDLNPAHAEAYCNRGNALRSLHRVEESLRDFEKAVALDPARPRFHWNRALSMLVAGDFEQGWREFEWRWRNTSLGLVQNDRNFRQPYWLGQHPLSGKTILLRCEQGLGDTLQFCRFAAIVADRGARVVLEVQPPLVELLSSLSGVAQVVAQGAALPSFDCYCSLMSLPLALGIRLDTIPAPSAYISAARDKATHWARRLADIRQPKVGLVWSGGFRPNQPQLWSINAQRNIPLHKLAPLKNEHITFVSLQKGQPAESELTDALAQGWAGPSLLDPTAELESFADTAALIENLDLVISVDTSTAHLAAAMGKPVWLLNRFDTCWRWLLHREDSPWYPGLRQYRQRECGNWDDVVERLDRDLRRWAAT